MLLIPSGLENFNSPRNQSAPSALVCKEKPMTAHEKEANQHGTHEDGGKKAKMAPQPSAPPGLEQDSKGNAIPFERRTKDDQEKTRRG
jgi:hypothetical protein